jgi:hypothetical protein
MGERGGHPGVVAGQPRLAGQRLPVGGVQPDPLPRQHVLVDGVPGQRVPELVPVPGLVHDQQMAFQGLAEGGEQLGLVQAGHPGQQPVGHPLPGHGGRAQQPLRRHAERVHPAQQDVDQGRGQVGRVAAAADHPGELLHQVGVAA